MTIASVGGARGAEQCRDPAVDCDDDYISRTFRRTSGRDPAVFRRTRTRVFVSYYNAAAAPYCTSSFPLAVVVVRCFVAASQLRGARSRKARVWRRPADYTTILVARCKSARSLDDWSRGVVAVGPIGAVPPSSKKKKKIFFRAHLIEIRGAIADSSGHNVEKLAKCLGFPNGLRTYTTDLHCTRTSKMNKVNYRILGRKETKMFIRGCTQ